MRKGKRIESSDWYVLCPGADLSFLRTLLLLLPSLTHTPFEGRTGRERGTTPSVSSLESKRKVA